MLRRLISFLLLAIVLSLPAFAQAESFDETLSKFESYAVKGMRDWKVPGMSIAMVKGDKVVYAKGFGTKRAGVNRPVDADTVFQVGSTTKAFTVALMATLVDEGKADWDDRVVDHFPNFMMYDPWVTREFRVHDLFAQHSGMPFYAGDLQSFIGFDRDHIIHSMRYIKPVYSFRDKFSYVNNLFVAGAKVEEKLTGKTWETLMQERILTPLKMTRSSMDEAGLTQVENGSDLHILVNGKAQPIKPGAALLDWPYTYGPAGGLNSSAQDMAKWAAAQLNGGKHGATRIFSQESAEYMHTPKTPVHIGEFHGSYCQAWMRTELEKTNVVWHNGGTSGICSFVGFSPDQDLAVVVLTNLGSHKLADALGLQFFEMMSGNDKDWNGTFLADLKKAEKAQAEAAKNTTIPNLPGLPLEAYAGKYHSSIYGDLTVYAEKKSLRIRLGTTQQMIVKVTHKTMHTFSGDWIVIDPADPEYHFDFTVDTEGDVTAITLREFNQDGTATFTRQ
ncbi:MAG: serine hydrolase [Pseudodesulfovibrio sp.]